MSRDRDMKADLKAQDDSGSAGRHFAGVRVVTVDEVVLVTDLSLELAPADAYGCRRAAGARPRNGR